ncbi:MAG: RES family NAD+ phosphorylase [Candidatus Cloacimonetes bacterium]|nr:RES family NAD+ phosphorylase [Candidatus Cloacimonadota bacterium]
MSNWFKVALERIKESQGNYIHNQNLIKKEETLLCSNCFKDEGLKIDAYNIGIKNRDTCPNCKSKIGNKLTRSLVIELCYVFFVRGTIVRSKFGGSPLIQFNEQHYNKSEVKVSSWLIEDLELVEKAGKVGLFYYGPRLWMVGEVEPLNSLQKEEEKNTIIDRIMNSYPTKILLKKEYFYRLRKNPKLPHNIDEYDTAPKEFLGINRFDKVDFPVLYGSPDLELCLHECRTTVEDNLYIAKLVPKHTLKMLDLSVLIEENNTEFESLDIAIHFLFLAGDNSYNICRTIACAAKEKGFDGIIYPSYYSLIRTGAMPFETVYGISVRRLPHLKYHAQLQSVPNVAVFGRPIKEKLITVDCINKVVINRVSYELTFGPIVT